MPKVEQRKKIRKLSVDLTGVEDRKGGKKGDRVPEGDYVLKVVDADVRKKEGADSKYVNWQLETVRGASIGKTLYHITTLKPEALWSFRNFMGDLLGKTIPKKALDIDLGKYIGREIGATVVDDEPYDNKIKSKIDNTFPAAEYQDEETDEEEDGDAEEAEEEVTSADDDEELEELDTDDL